MQTLQNTGADISKPSLKCEYASERAWTYPTAKYDANGSKIQIKKFMREVAVEKQGYISDVSAKSGATNGPMIAVVNGTVSKRCDDEWVRNELTEIIYHPYKPSFRQSCRRETLGMLTISKKKSFDEPLPVAVTSQLRRHN